MYIYIYIYMVTPPRSTYSYTPNYQYVLQIRKSNNTILPRIFEYFDVFWWFWCILMYFVRLLWLFYPPPPPQHSRDVTPFYGTMDLYKSKRSTEASQCRGSWGSLEFTERILDKIDDLNLCLQKRKRETKRNHKKVSGFPKKNNNIISNTVDGRNPKQPPGMYKTCKDWDRLPINWCRISSINSIFLWVHRGIAEYFSD